MVETATGRVCPVCRENPAEEDTCPDGGFTCECCARCRAYCEEDSDE